MLDLHLQVNFIGDGINYCARLMNVKDADVLYVSKDFREAIGRGDLAGGPDFQLSHLPIKHKPEPDKLFFLKLHQF